MSANPGPLVKMVSRLEIDRLLPGPADGLLTVIVMSPCDQSDPQRLVMLVLLLPTAVASHGWIHPWSSLQAS